ncbi:putative C6 transcription factor [Aspergillus undulatus]|uniref:putative C6 transcription factor n=1 Tax=Aspergillus undulatus TaxID=1810928 RepID=UPI003CCCE85C
MQSLVLSPSFVTPEFGRLRNPGPERHLYSQPRPANARRGTPRDLPLPCSMSSSVPAEDLLETLGNARRPGHSDLPKPVTTAAVTSSGTAVASTAAPGPIFSPESPDPLSVRQSTQQRFVTAPGDDTLRQPFAYTEHFSAPQYPPTFTGRAPSQPSTVTHPQPTFGPATTGPAPRALPQKTTRRTKAHVASACVNCKKKHLGCDPARPCRRCVLSGKADTCVDVTHKKRGRPPLKADEGSLRAYASHLDPPGAMGGQGPQARRPMHRATSSRELRPMTDLQHLQGTQRAMMGTLSASGPQQQWSPALYPHSIDPSLTTQRTMGHRRFSSSGSTQSMTAVSPPGYVAMPPGYNPALAPGRMPAGVGRPISSYPNPGMHPTPSPPQYHQAYGVPMSPYPENPRVISRLPMAEGSVQRDTREAYVEFPVRLPPIYPSPVANPQPTRPTEPYPAPWSPSQQQMQDPRQHQSGVVEPLSPSDQVRQAPSEVGSLGLLGVLSSPEDSSQQLPPTRTYDEQRDHDVDDGDSSRPAKRRKMALDDMVND